MSFVEKFELRFVLEACVLVIRVIVCISTIGVDVLLGDCPPERDASCELAGPVLERAKNAVIGLPLWTGAFFTVLAMARALERLFTSGERIGGLCWASHAATFYSNRRGIKPLIRVTCR